jgi:hypothetical protein
VRDLEGDPAREDARDDATMAFASELTVTDDDDLARRGTLAVFRLGGRESWPSEAETNESSDEA